MVLPSKLCSAQDAQCDWLLPVLVRPGSIAGSEIYEWWLSSVAAVSAMTVSHCFKCLIQQHSDMNVIFSAAGA
eukprot:scaffold429994_cov17-Prasinocladus_malaysianus.AAC.1